MLAAAVGVEGLAIVAESDAVLVCRLDRAQAVKDVVERLKAEGRLQTDVTAGGPKTLADWARRYRRWLNGAALPLWWTAGADHAGWGFQERLDLDGRPTTEARRARVQTRQTWVYAMAGELGWPGPWKAAVAWGLDGLIGRYRRADGLYRTRVGADGAPLDDTAMLYDQAFMLLALSAGRTVRPSADADALALLDAVEAQMRHPTRGFRESGEHPFQANAQMHLFEACLAWIEAGGGPRWEKVAAEIAALALDRFIDAEGGFLREFFTEDWSPAPGDAGRLVEPGHQFEWTWLLTRWAKRTGDGRAAAAAQRLYAAGRRGIDPIRGVTIDALNPDLSVQNASARLWPQTEWMKAALITGDAPQAMAACAGLWTYLEVETPGVWRDKYRPDGTFVDEPAPASSLYHIVAAITELERAAGGA
jgi:mannose/cellobiose epimerase-like protein (N-acyl-D-glucosamine 2-epimerase family)